MKKLLALLIIVFGIHAALAAQTNSIAHSVMSQTNIDSLTNVVRILSGEAQVIINGTETKIYSRYAENPGNDLAANYLHAKLEEYGLEVTDQYFSITGRNVLGKQCGTVYPDKIFIISAHYDSMPNYSISPGADDNASGCAAVIEAARIISECQTDYTIIYALFDNEESGMLGSMYYAAYAKTNNLDIMGVINLDMIGFGYDRDAVANIHTTIRQECMTMANKMVEINNTYGLNLALEIYNPGTERSDHWSFIQYGYPALLLIEDLEGGDLNGKYHSVDDKLQYFEIEYYHSMSRTAIGTLAELIINTTIADIGVAEPVLTKFSLMQNYPNPFNPSTTINYIVADGANVSIKLYDIPDNETTTLLDEYKTAGNYSITVDTGELGSTSSGVYFYTMRAGNTAITKKMLFLK